MGQATRYVDDLFQRFQHEYVENELKKMNNGNSISREFIFEIIRKNLLVPPPLLWRKYFLNDRRVVDLTAEVSLNRGLARLLHYLYKDAVVLPLCEYVEDCRNNRGIGFRNEVFQVKSDVNAAILQLEELLDLGIIEKKQKETIITLTENGKIFVEEYEDTIDDLALKSKWSPQLQKIQKHTY